MHVSPTPSPEPQEPFLDDEAVEDGDIENVEDVENEEEEGEEDNDDDQPYELYADESVDDPQDDSEM